MKGFFVVNLFQQHSVFRTILYISFVCIKFITERPGENKYALQTEERYVAHTDLNMKPQPTRLFFFLSLKFRQELPRSRVSFVAVLPTTQVMSLNLQCIHLVLCFHIFLSHQRSFYISDNYRFLLKYLQEITC